MAYNGAGTFLRLYNWLQDKVNSEKIQAARMDAEFDGIATGLSTAITKDGQTTITAAIPFNGQRITGLGDATADQDAVSRRFADRRYMPFDCRLVYVSSVSIRLDRVYGRSLFINGIAETIPSAGVTMSNGSLGASTLYYIYAYMSGSTMTLEGSTTASATDSTYGHLIKTGDATRTLVGMVQTTNIGTFSDSTAGRWVASLFNRRQRDMVGATSTYTTASTSQVELNTALRVSFLTWGEEAVDIVANGYGYNDTANQFVAIQVAMDVLGGKVSSGANPTANGPVALSTRYPITLATGVHTASIWANVQGGTGSFEVALAGTVTI